MAQRCWCAQVFFWDRRTGKLPVSCVGARHASGQLLSLQAVPDGRVIYAGTQAGEVREASHLMAQAACPREPHGTHAECIHGLSSCLGTGLHLGYRLEEVLCSTSQ